MLKASHLKYLLDKGESVMDMNPREYSGFPIEGVRTVDVTLESVFNLKDFFEKEHSFTLTSKITKEIMHKGIYVPCLMVNGSEEYLMGYKKILAMQVFLMHAIQPEVDTGILIHNEQRYSLRIKDFEQMQQFILKKLNALLDWDEAKAFNNMRHSIYKFVYSPRI